MIVRPKAMSYLSHAVGCRSRRANVVVLRLNARHTCRVIIAFIALITKAAILPSASSAQGWMLDIYAGGARTGALATLPSSNLVANIRWSGLSAGSLYASAAAPLGSDATTWGAVGAAYRWNVAPLAALGWGLDSGVDGYAYRDPTSDSDGFGVTLRALPFVSWRINRGALEVEAGRREHLFRNFGESDSRGVWEAAMSAQYAAGPALAVLQARWLAAPEAEYPFAGVQLVTNHPWGRAWAGAGAWLADSLDDAGWNVGASIDVARYGEVWASYRADAADPLYRSEARRSWTVGVSVPLGRRPALPRVELAPSVEAGRARIRLPLDLAAAGGGSDNGHDGAATLAVAGEFSGWKPVPMRRSGDEWVVDLQLASGVYRFAFVDADGEWFVPEGYPGRIGDGMGGYIALLIVP